ncbi:DUF308 domain-containing protein [Paenibacillus sp. MBLB4367]|uniref:YqeB family protein n=1 Tax=Paenibacillus sp. MBLB4367 TaxID=3384767 RepID=UPI0039082A81
MNEQRNATVLGLTSTDKLLVGVVPPVVGLVLGWFIPAIAEWAVSLPWVPFKGLFELIVSFQGVWVIFLTTCIGFFAGLALTYYVFRESLVVYLSDEDVRLHISGAEQSFGREEVSVAFLDGKQLVLIGQADQELYREKHESKNDKVAEAFRQHGYYWSQADPFKDAYRRWVPDMPDLTPGANALLKAREKALQKDEKEDVNDLKRELAKLGIAVREEGKRQYWREHKRAI